MPQKAHIVLAYGSPLDSVEKLAGLREEGRPVPPVELPSSFKRSLAALDAGDLSAAASEAQRFAAEYPSAAEAEMLPALIRRRELQPDGSWLEAFLGAWEDAGKPVEFELMRGESVEAFVSNAVRSMVQGVGDGSPWGELRGPLPLSMLAQWADVDGSTLNAVRAAERAESWLDCLWCLPLLGNLRASPDVRARARAARAGLWRKLVELRPDDFHCRSMQTLDGEPVERLALRQIEQLNDAVSTCRRSMELGEIYRALCDAREARNATMKSACLEDAMVMLPAPVGQILYRFKHRLARQHREAATGLAALVGERFARSGVLIERLCALSLLERVAQHRGDTLGKQAIAAQLAQARRLVAKDKLLLLDWPLEGLTCEVVDAQAENEVALFERCLFPAS